MIEGTEISRHGIPLAQLNYQIVLTKYIDGSIHYETTQQDKRSKATTAKAYIKQSPFEIWGTGEQTRGFTYIEDIVNALVLIAQHVDDASSINVGTSEYISLNRIADEIYVKMQNVQT